LQLKNVLGKCDVTLVQKIRDHEGKKNAKTTSQQWCDILSTLNMNFRKTLAFLCVVTREHALFVIEE
jgi:SET domain-containing protein